MWKGHVFTSVCQEFCPPGGGEEAGVCGGGSCMAGGMCGGGGECVAGGGGRACVAEEMATAAVGTHHTKMNSCVKIICSVKLLCAIFPSKR